jgi:hypothetical protein
MSFYVTATETTITFHVTAVEGRSYYRLYWRLASETIATTKDFSTTEDFTYTVTGLTPGTAYAANVAHWQTSPTVDGDNSYILMGAQTITTDATGSRPSDWSWQNIAAGVPIPIYMEKLAPVSAGEWNSFCARINEFRAYKSMSNYAFTTLTAGTSFSVAIVNEAITAINAISGAGTTPTQIRPLQATFWLDLAAALNAIA